MLAVHALLVALKCGSLAGVVALGRAEERGDAWERHDGADDYSA